VESVLFLDYIEKDQIPNLKALTHDINLPNLELLTEKDYLLGMCDFTGELMRLCIGSAPDLERMIQIRNTLRILRERMSFFC
jgi:predicted translin family RNA/ssDNA-binding protein